MTIDTRYFAETPEGIPLALRPAGVPSRFRAYLIDFLIRWAVYIALGMALQYLGGVGSGLMMVSYFLIEWLYPVLFEMLPKHATPGKRIMGLTVVMDSGLPLTLGASVLRNLLRAVDFLPFGYALGMFCMLCRSDFKRLGDLAAGTLVVYAQEVREEGRIPDAQPLAPARALSFPEQEAVLSWAARSTRLTSARAEELAELAEHILPPRAPSAEATPLLLGVAHWVMGRR